MLKNKQVDKSHYNFFNYVTPSRFMSFYHQLYLIYSINPKSILEVGPGNNFLKNQLNEDFIFKTIDIADDLNPDYIGGAEEMPLEDNSFDLICCFQVLEHIPFEQFEPSLQELQRVAKSDILLSLPYARYSLKWEFEITQLSTLRFHINIPKFYKKHKKHKEHYWEIGKKNYPKSKIKQKIQKYFTLKEISTSGDKHIFIPYENPYHMFFHLKPFK